MISKRWLKNLADSAFRSGKWQHHRGIDMNLPHESEIHLSLQKFEEILSEACKQFNYNKKLDSQIKILGSLSNSSKQAPVETNNFVLLLGNCRVILQYEKGLLDVQISRNKYFEHETEQTLQFQVTSQSLGNVLWLDKTKTLFTEELLVMHTLEELVKIWSQNRPTYKESEETNYENYL